MGSVSPSALIIVRVAIPRLPTPPRHTRIFTILCTTSMLFTPPPPDAAEADSTLAPGKGVVLVVLQCQADRQFSRPYVYLLLPPTDPPSSVNLDTFPACDTCAYDPHLTLSGTRSACSGFSATSHAGTRFNLRRYVRVGFRSWDGSKLVHHSFCYLGRLFPEIADTARLTPYIAHASVFPRRRSRKRPRHLGC